MELHLATHCGCSYVRARQSQTEPLYLLSLQFQIPMCQTFDLLIFACGCKWAIILLAAHLNLTTSMFINVTYDIAPHYTQETMFIVISLEMPQ
jgi:hypothetical protein